MGFYMHFSHVISYCFLRYHMFVFFEFFGDFWFSVDFMTFFMNFTYFFFYSFFSFLWLWRFSIYPTYKSTSSNTKYLCYRSYRNIFDFSIIFYIFFNSFIEDNYWLLTMLIAFFNISTASFKSLFSFFKRPSSFASSLEKLPDPLNKYLFSFLFFVSLYCLHHLWIELFKIPKFFCYLLKS